MRIFVSYTLRDGVINIDLLRDIEAILGRIGSPYIDLLHNDSSEPQRHVMEMLYQAEIFCICLTPKFYYSEWVQKELTVARSRQLTIISLDLGFFDYPLTYRIEL